MGVLAVAVMEKNIVCDEAFANVTTALCVLYQITLLVLNAAISSSVIVAVVPCM